MSGILTGGAYLPRHRLDRAAIAATLGGRGGRGTRAVACFDEDTTTLGVEAARIALASAPANATPEALYFATAGPAYLDKTNATAIHAALDLDRFTSAIDLAGAVRSGAGALRIGLQSPQPALVVLADVRTGLPGGADEREGGDAGAALLVGGGAGPFIAELLAHAATTDEFLDRWRIPGRDVARRWVEHFAADLYVDLGLQALGAALERAQLGADEVDRLIVTGTHTRAVSRLGKTSGVREEALAPDLADTVGNTGTAHAGLLLTAALEQGKSGETIALVVLGDGAEAFVFRTTPAIEHWRSARPLAEQLAAEVPYGRFLAWRGMLTPEPTRRPAPAPPVAPASHRTEGWKLAFHGSRCTNCQAIQVPPQRVCYACRAVDQMEMVRLADRRGIVVTATVDRLAWSPSPPSTFAILDLDGGGRVQLEVTDVEPGDVEPGQRMELTFRRAYTQGDIHNYLWKARPLIDKEDS
jgi:hydroxymethylglutaryl-CoA synthase